MDDFDKEVAKIHRRKVVPSLIFSSDTAVALVIVALLVALFA